MMEGVPVGMVELLHSEHLDSKSGTVSTFHLARSKQPGAVHFSTHSGFT